MSIKIQEKWSLLLDSGGKFSDYCKKLHLSLSMAIHLMFAGKARAYTSEAPFRCSTLAPFLQFQQ